MPKKFRVDGRFFDEDQVFTVLGVYYGTLSITELTSKANDRYPKTWRARTLIAVHRALNNANPGRRSGYGKDWIASIRPEIQAFEEYGLMPFQALNRAAELIRQAEMLQWALASPQLLVQQSSPLVFAKKAA